MRDRVPTYPGRVRQIPVDGQPGVYDLIMADEPIEVGDPPIKSNLLTDVTASLYGLGPEATVNEVLELLALPADRYAYFITVTLPDGTPMAGVTVSGVTSLSGGALVTDANGSGVGMSPNASVTLTATSPYLDIDNYSQSVASTGRVTRVTAEMSAKTNRYMAFATTTTFKFSPLVVSYDACAGGGGGGSGGTSDEDAAGGGGGGYVTNVLGLTPTAGSTFTTAIGAGGAASLDNGSSSSIGGTGGSSNLRENTTIVVSANGGAGGRIRDGGMGNGNGGNARNPGNPGTVYEFDDNTRGLLSGGGGGGIYLTNGVLQPGGAPYGGAGGRYDVTAQNGRGPGGGGGGKQGGGGLIGGAGFRGQVSVRWRYA